MLKDKFRCAMVTGGAGFIGSHIVEECLAQGLEVVSIDNYFAGKHENLLPLKKKYGDRLREIECDVTDYEKLKNIMGGGIDLIFHEAASKKTICLNDPRRDFAINAGGTFNILELARDFGVKKIVHASTGSVYGEAKYFPQDENHPLNPTSYYGVSKLAGEKYVRAFTDLYNMDCTILRYFHVYGPRQEMSDVGGVVSIFGRRILNGQAPVIHGDGMQERSFTYVKDIVGINILAAEKEGISGQVFNCASGIKVTIEELANKVKCMLHAQHLENIYDDWTIGDIKHFDISNEKVRNLGYNFKTSFDEGLKETLDWLREYLKK